MITSGGQAPYHADYGSSGSSVSYNGTPVGLYGNGAYEGGSFVSWLSVGSHMENLQKTDGVELEDTGNIVVSGENERLIDKHPGFGKTRKIIVDMVKEHLLAKRRITLLAPTRVVLAEMTDVLKEKGIAYETSQGKYSKALVVAMCHATFTNVILGSGPARNVRGTIVMDEAHFLDCRSIAGQNGGPFHERTRINSLHDGDTSRTEPGAWPEQAY